MDAAAVKQALGVFKRGLQDAAVGLGHVASVVADEAPGIFSQSKTLRDYRLLHPTATCGPENLWAIYAGESRKPGEKRAPAINAFAAQPHRSSLPCQSSLWLQRSSLRDGDTSPGARAGAVQKDVSIWILDKKRVQDAAAKQQQ